MVSLRHLLILILAWTLLCAWPVTAGTSTLDWMPSLIVQDYLGTARVINNYTMTSDTSTINATWQLLGTDDQKLFSLLDSRKDATLSAGVLEQYNISNTGSFKYYYLYLVSGFDTGTTIEYHLDYTITDYSPKEEFTQYFNFTQKRSPLVMVFDFSRTSPNGSVMNYTITSSATFGNLQAWYLYGTNTSPFLGSSNPALFTLLDTRTSIAFTASVTQMFDISDDPPFKYYILYVRDGFPTFGTRLEFRFISQPVPPIVIPTVKPVSAAETVVPPTYASTTVFYFIGSTSLITMIAALVLSQYNIVLSGISLLTGLISGLSANTINAMRVFTFFDPPTYLADGTAITEATYVTTTVHVVHASPELTILFGIVVILMVVNIIRIIVSNPIAQPSDDGI